MKSTMDGNAHAQATKGRGKWSPAHRPDRDGAAPVQRNAWDGGRGNAPGGMASRCDIHRMPMPRSRPASITWPPCDGIGAMRGVIRTRTHARHALTRGDTRHAASRPSRSSRHRAIAATRPTRGDAPGSHSFAPLALGAIRVCGVEPRRGEGNGARGIAPGGMGCRGIATRGAAWRGNAPSAHTVAIMWVAGASRGAPPAQTPNCAAFAPPCRCGCSHNADT